MKTKAHDLKTTHYTGFLKDACKLLGRRFSEYQEDCRGGGELRLSGYEYDALVNNGYIFISGSSTSMNWINRVINTRGSAKWSNMPLQNKIAYNKRNSAFS